MPTAKIVCNQWNGVLNWRSINYKLHRFPNFKRIEVRSPLTTLYGPGPSFRYDYKRRFVPRSVCFAVAKCRRREQASERTIVEHCDK